MNRRRRDPFNEALAEVCQEAGVQLPGEPPRELDSTWLDDFELKLDRPGLVDGLLDREGISLMVGASGAGKTFAAVSLAGHVGAGLPWHGMPVEKGVVVYLASESPESVKRRLWAWKARHDVERLPVLVVQSPVDLLSGDDEAVCALVRQIHERHGRVALVVIDTLSRATTGDENSGQDLGAFIAACGRIREAGQCHLMLVHHLGKDLTRGARGHSCLRAAVDTELEVTGDGSSGCIKVTKARDDAGGRAFGFKLETVELGTNARGRVVTTCVASEAEVTSVTSVTNAPPLGANQRVTREALAAALVDKGRTPPPAPDIPPGTRAVRVDDWREASMRYLPQAETKHRAQAFKRAMERLVADRLVRHAGGWCWLPGRDGEGHSGHKGHKRPDVTGCDRTESPGHNGHTVTHPLRGVTDVTVTDDGRRVRTRVETGAPGRH